VRRTDGTVLTLAMAVRNHYSASMATVTTAGLRRTDRVRDYLAERRANLNVPADAPMRTIFIERDVAGRGESLAVVLARNGIEVTLNNGLPADAVPYPNTKGPNPPLVLAVDLAQPQGRLAKALLEPDATLDSAFIREELERRRTAQPNRFYDVTAWSLPMAFGVRAWTSKSAPGPKVVFQLAPPGQIVGGRAAHAYAFAPGSESALRMLGTLFRDSILVYFAPKAFKIGAADFPSGAFIVRVAPNGERVHASVERAARESGMRTFALNSALVETGTDLGSNSVIPMRAPRVAMLGGESVNGNSFGFAWYALEQRLGYPVTTVEANFITNPAFSSFNVLVMPSANGVPAMLGEEGVRRLQQWVRDGGTLITIENATSWLASTASGLSRLRPRSAARDSSSGPALSASIPGAMLRVDGDTLSPLLAGLDPARLAVLANGDRAFEAPRDARPQEAVLRMPERARLRMSGYLWPESWDRQARAVYLWSERVGRGRVVGFAGDPNYRDLMRGLLPLFGHAVFFNSY
jgi:hypothetical protein